MAVLGLFPGQGSQSVGMGAEWISSHPLAQELASRADEALGFSISKLCLEGPIEELTLTQNAQPALLLAAYTSYACSEISIDCAAGHSLGEYTALVAAGVLAFEDAISVVHKRGIFMQEAVPAGTGSMLAVLGSTDEELDALIKEGSDGSVEVANLNSPGQTVLAGTKEGIDTFQNFLTEKGVKAKPLNVSAPFHCSLMKPAQEKLSVELDAITFSDPTITVYSNVTAQKISSGNEARQLLKDQVCGTVRWTEQMGNMIANESVVKAIEFGPGGVLSRLLKRIDKSVERCEIDSPDSLANMK